MSDKNPTASSSTSLDWDLIKEQRRIFDVAEADKAAIDAEEQLVIAQASVVTTNMQKGLTGLLFKQSSQQTGAPDHPRDE